MALPIIQIDQAAPGPGNGTPGQSPTNLVLNQEVQLSDTANGAGTYAFEFLGIPGASAAVLNNVDTPTPSFTPDAYGNYLIKETFVDTDGLTWVQTVVAGVRTPNNDWVIPAPGETKETGDDGWAYEREEAILAIDTGFATGFLNLVPNDALGVGDADKALIRYNEAAGRLEASIAGDPYEPISGTPVAVEDDGSPVTAAAKKLDFAGAGVVITEPTADEVLVTIAGVAASNLAVEDEGGALTASATKLNFAGAGVEATQPVGGEILVTIPGGVGLPALTGVLNAVLKESPIGVVSWGRLTEDDIDPPFLVSLTLDTEAATREVGDALINPAFDVGYTGDTAAAATLSEGSGDSDSSGYGGPVVLGSPYLTGSLVGTWNARAGATGNNDNRIFQVSADSVGGITGKIDTINVVWRPRVFWGAVVAGTFNEAFIEALANSALAANRNRTLNNFDGGSSPDDKNIYFAWPTAYGTGTPTFNVNGFDGGFTIRPESPISVTNADGHIQDYDLWESNNINLGIVTIVVS